MAAAAEAAGRPRVSIAPRAALERDRRRVSATGHLRVARPGPSRAAWRPRAASTRSRTAAELSPGARRELACVGWPTVERDVDAVGERPAELRPVAAHLAPGALALARRRSPRPHGHGLAATTSWKRHGSSIQWRARAISDPPVLERLAERLERVAAKLGQLVEEEHPAVGSEISPGRGGLPPPTQAGDRDRVMRRPERTHAGGERVERPPAGARDPHRLDRLRRVERRQHRRQPPRRHRLPCPGRPHHDQAVPAGGGELQRAGRPSVARAARRGPAGPTPRAPPSRGEAARAAPAPPSVPSAVSWFRLSHRDRPAGRGQARPPPRPRAGTTNPRASARAAASAIGRIPGTLRIEPSSASSPASVEPGEAFPRAAARRRRGSPPRSRGRSQGPPCAGPPERGWR